MLIKYPQHSKGQWKNLVLASDSSNQQNLVLKNQEHLLRSNTQKYSHLKVLYQKIV